MFNFNIPSISAPIPFEGPFSDPGPLRSQSGVYVILSEEPGGYFVIDAGQAGDVKDRVSKHDRKDCWSRKAKGPLTVVARYMNKQQRMWLERVIRKHYNPRCGII